MPLTNGDCQLSFTHFKWESDELGYVDNSYPRFVKLTCEFKSQYFHTSYRLSVRSDKLTSFISDLEKAYRTLKEKAKIFDLEGHLECCVSPNLQGQIEVSGYIRTFNPTNQMLFEFVTDQTFLPPLIRELKMEFAKLKSGGK